MRNLKCRRDHYRQVHLLGNVANAFVSPKSEDLQMAGIDGIYFRAKTASNQIRKHRSTHRTGPLGRADHCHGVRDEQFVQARLYSSFRRFPLHARTGTFRHFFARLGSSLKRHALMQALPVHVLVRQLRNTPRSSSQKSSVLQWSYATARSSSLAPVSELPPREQLTNKIGTEVVLTIVFARACVPLL